MRFFWVSMLWNTWPYIRSHCVNRVEEFCYVFELAHLERPMWSILSYSSVSNWRNWEILASTKPTHQAFDMCYKWCKWSGKSNYMHSFIDVKRVIGVKCLVKLEISCCLLYVFGVNLIFSRHWKSLAENHFFVRRFFLFNYEISVTCCDSQL